MKAFLLVILTALSVSNLNAQVLFSTVATKLKTVKHHNSTQLICSTSTMQIKFQLNRNVIAMQQSNFVTIDSQVIQIIPLKFSGNKKDSNLSSNDQKQLLDIYSKYELNYFKNDLNVEVVNPSQQWVITKARGWLVWYFRVGNTLSHVNKQTEI